MTATRPTRAPPPAIILSAEQRERYVPGPALRAAYERLHPLMRRLALSLADHDEDFADDLLQEAWIRLWEMDPSRFGDADQAYVKQALFARMLDALDHELREGKSDRQIRADFWLR